MYPEHSSAFADEGDSGSLVHLVSENNGEQSIRAIGMLVGGTTYGTGIVTPIWAILDNFDLPNQLLASDDQRIRKLYRGMTDVKTELTSIKTERVNIKTELSSKIDSLLSLIHRNTPNP